MMRQIDKYICTCQVCIDKGIIKANPPQKHTKFLFGSVRSTNIQQPNTIRCSAVVRYGPPRRSKRHIACSDFFQKSERAHFAAPPFQTATALLGCSLVLNKRSEMRSPGLYFAAWASILYLPTPLSTGHERNKNEQSSEQRTLPLSPPTRGKSSRLAPLEHGSF